jgi:hypothetical protein
MDLFQTYFFFHPTRVAYLNHVITLACLGFQGFTAFKFVEEIVRSW